MFHGSNVMLRSPSCLLCKLLSRLDFRLYHSAITAAATLLYSLYPLDLVYRFVGSWDFESQMSELWHQFSVWGKQGLPDYEVYKLIVQHKIDKDKYPLTECDVITLLNHYNEPCYEDRFLHPYECPFLEKDDEEEIGTIFRDIKGVVDKMECFQIDQVDDYTRLLIKIFRGDRLTEHVTSINKYEPLFAAAEGRIVDTTCFEEPRWLLFCQRKVFPSKK